MSPAAHLSVAGTGEVAVKVTSDDQLQHQASRLGASLLRRGQRAATAESCTGGFIAKCLTDIPGSSNWFERGYVTYSNASKTADLGVPAGLIARHGAVSEPVARAMARGALRASGADLAVAVTGIAGPDGGMPGKPVGTVWFAWARRQGARITVNSRCRRFKGSRDAVRRQTVASAIAGLQRP
jgi:nicotinamide-nucleotide amidase